MNLRTKWITLIVSLALCLSFSVFAQTAPDYFPRSQALDPPGGLVPEQCPMFVTIGFDDNGDNSGMEWAVSYFKNLKNPVGDGNVGTFDGTDARVTFFMTTAYIDASHEWGGGAPWNWAAWVEAKNDGHEIGTHTHNHPHGRAFTQSQWEAEMNQANSWLMKPEAEGGLGLATAPSGFRTPFLEFGNPTFSAAKSVGFLYDCSIEDPWDEIGADPRYYPWPYTLDEGTPQNSVPPVPGLWELPVHPLHNSAGSKITGFDYNVWRNATSGGTYLDVLKASLALRLEGNRHPFLIGAHSDFYSPDWTGSSVPYLDRQKAVEDFIQYALNLQVDGRNVVRIVPFETVVEWMKDPVPLFWAIKTEMNGEPLWEQRNGSTTPTHYSGGDHVSYNGKEYRCKWWTTAVPEGSADWELWTGPSQLTYNGVIKWQDDPAGTGQPVSLPVDGYVAADTGDTKILTFVPNAGYEVGEVIVDGVNFGKIESIAFSDIAENHKVRVTWVEPDPAQVTWTLNTSVVGGGAVYPANGTKVVEGFSQPVKVVEKAGSPLVSVTFDGIALTADANGLYWIPAQTGTAAHTLEAVFGNVQPVQVSLSTNAGGTTLPAPGNHTLYPGETFVLTTQPDTGYRVVSVTAGLTVITPVSENLYHIPVTEAVAVSVVFEAVPVHDVTINVTLPAGGAVEPGAGIYPVTEGSGFQVSVQAKRGYSVSASVDGAPAVIEDGKILLTQITASKTIDVVFTSRSVHMISASVNPDDDGVVYGRISPAGQVAAFDGIDQTFSLIPEKGASIKSLIVDGQAVTAPELAYTFENVTAAHTIEVTFTDGSGGGPVEFTIDTSAVGSWTGGFSGNVVITNISATDLQDWSLEFTLPAGYTINGWNAIYSMDSATRLVTVTPPSWGPWDIPAGSSISFGAQGSYSGDFSLAFLDNATLNYTGGSGSGSGGTGRAPANVGLRSSMYGAKDLYDFPTPAQWDDAGDALSAYASGRPVGTETEMVWIIGKVDTTDSVNGGCWLEMASPAGGAVDPLIDFRPETRNHHEFLSYFDANDIKVFLQVEPGHADVAEIIDLVFTEFGGYDCITGFGVDIEWYNNSNEQNVGEESVDWPTVYSWMQQVDSYGQPKGKDYKFFVKHWLTDKLPQPNTVGTAPGEAELFSRLVYIDDTQFLTNWDDWNAEMVAFADFFAPNPVGFQIGYASDWWGEGFIGSDGWYDDMDPAWAGGVPEKDLFRIPKMLTDRLGADLADPNQEFSVYWVDFTMKQLMPNILQK